MSVEILSTENKEFLNCGKEWLIAYNQILAEIYLPHSGAGTDLYVIDSLKQLEDLIRNIAPKTFITLVRGPIFLLQGIVNDNFISQTCTFFAARDTYQVVSPDIYPEQYQVFGWGTHAAGLEQILNQLRGQLVWIGEEPCILSPDDALEEDLTYYIFAQKPE